MAADPSDHLIGRVLRGAYLVQEKLADGANEAVYKALHTALDAPFAVKVLKRDVHAEGGDAVARFRREARALSRLRHPNLVAVTDFGETDDGTLFVVMEYVTGRTLARVVAEEAPLDEARVVQIGAQILGALAEAHARQILHGTLSPAKVMVESRRDGPESVKVLDFGVANIQLGVAAATPPSPASASPYQSPEQRAGEDLDARSDLFALGAVLYELLTGTVPFDAPDAGTPALPPPPSVRSGRPVSPELERVVMRALAPHRFDRFETADQMRDALLRCAVRRAATETESADVGPTAVLPRRGARRASAPGATVARATRAAAAAGTRALSRRTPQRAPATPRPGGSRERPGPASALDPAAVREVEQRALALLGPVATYIVGKAGGVATTVEELCDIVATFIPSERDRDAFLTATAAATRTRARTPPGSAPRPAARTPVTWDPALLDGAARALAAHVGPVARVLVKRACATARTPEQLVDLLARELHDDATRAAFRRAMGAWHTGAR